MKTYAETEHEKPFDWNKFLSQERISGREWGKAKLLAQDWVTCACGSLCDIIPRSSTGAPKDIRLEMLGVNFYADIAEQRKDLAKETLQKIETRAAQIITEIKTFNHEKENV